MHGTVHQHLHGRRKCRHHQAGADAAGKYTNAKGDSAGRLADQRQPDRAKTTSRHGRVTGPETIGGEGGNQRSQHETEKWKRANDTDQIGCQVQVGANGWYKQTKSKARKTVTDRNQRGAE